MKLTATLILSSILAASALDVKLSGVNYNPRKGEDWQPLDKKCKSATEVAADMKSLATITSNIRLYSMTDCNQVELVVPAAKAAGLTVWAGLWVDNNTATYLAEKTAFAGLIQKGVIDSTVIGLHVGSEAIYRKEITADQAIKNFQEVKAMVTAAGLKFPVTIADIGDTYVANPQLVTAVDIVSANAFPFWENKPIEGIIQHFYTRMTPLINLAAAANKKIMISETGWATAGKAAGAGVASPENAATWMNDFFVLATDLKWSYYYYTSFDTTWRTNSDPTANATDGNVEHYFGIFDSTGVMKPAYANLKVKKRVDIATGAKNSSTTATNATTTKPTTGTTTTASNTTSTTKPTTTTTAAPATGANVQSASALVQASLLSVAAVVAALW
ncbi:Aste57867_21209 [Aphanomyces stellatus]|uniref:glucan endo-1,3-beta-D-glucosidase n=1 Tax=Aphanomyces stellatus TaxID=120398 RepID=A0A485LLK7_9STRA|nr:hypothetical protein As57867_021141 [Aphanomyces stellatus]VFT97882.1 Aste57867_21209 [Aphanomyces stellatus]